MDYNLIIDTENRRLLTEYTSTEVGTPPVIIYGDKPTVSVRLVKANDNNSEWPWRDDGDLTGQTIRVGIGAGSQPSAGQYTLLYGGDETTALAYNADSATISTAVNLLPSIIAAGGVTVENVDGIIRFTFTDDGARTGITANVDNIYPTSSTYVHEVVTGDVSTASVQHLVFESNLCAYVELTDDVATPTSNVTTVREGVTNTTSELQRIELLNNPIKGSYTITIGAQTTTPLDVDSNIDSIVDAVEAMQQFEVGDIIATGTTHDYTLEFDKSLGNVGEATINMDNIQGADVGKTGTIDLHTTGIAELLAGNTEAEATLEVVRWTTADVAGETVLQVPVEVRQDIIPDTPPSQTPMPTYATINLNQINQSGAASGQVPSWNGSEWVPITASGTGDLLASANLSDVANAATSLSNLGGAPLSHTHTSGDIDAEASLDGYVLTSDGAGNAAWEVVPGGHDPVTVSDSAEIDFTLTGQDITASIVASSIDETKLDASTNASLDLADSASQPGHTHTSTEITNNTSESTGVLTGGVLSTGAGAAEFSISDGTGQIVDATGAVTAVSWSGLSNITPTNIATNLLTWVGINSGGNLVEKVTAFTSNEIRNTIVLGVIVHTDNTTTQTTNNQQVVAYQPLSTAYDIADAIGFVNKSGNVFSANGPTMSIAKSAGVLFKIGSNFDTDPTGNPHNKTLAAITPVTFEYRYSDGSSQAPWLTTIDPDNLDDGAGGNTAVGNNRWSVQRIYSFVSNNVKLQRGVEDFATKSAAIEGIASEAYVTEPSIAANGLLRGWLVLKKGATDLSDPAQAQFIEAPKFGESSAGGASTPPGDASVILIEALKATAGTITAGSVVRTTGYNGTRVLVELADADAAGETPGLGIARETITDAIAGNVVVFGKLEGIDTSSFSVADTLYLSTTPGVLTNTRPTGATTGIQAIARVLDVDATNGIVEVVGAGRTNALPQMNVDTMWYGDGTGTPAETSITAAGRAILAAADASAQRTTLSAQEDISGATLTAVTVASADKVLVQDADDSDNLKTVTAQSIADLGGGGGGGGLTQTTGTAADTAMAVGNMYVVDMSAWTSDYIYRLPTTAAAGDQIGITISTGDDTYTLDIRTTLGSNDKINGVDHASSDWSKLFQTGETVVFECVVTNSEWVVVNDGRITCSSRLEKTDSQTPLTDATYDQIEYTTEAWNYGMITDVVSNYRITVRRGGMYHIGSYTCLDDTELTFINNDVIYGRVYVDGTGANEVQWCNVGADGNADRMAAQYQTTLELNADQYVEMFITHNTTTGADLATVAALPNWLEVREII